MAFINYYGQCSNNIAEAKVILHGLQWCAHNGYYDKIVELESLVIIRMINTDSNVTWQVDHIIREISYLKIQENYTFAR